jgi:hypothetical protein
MLKILLLTSAFLFGTSSQACMAGYSYKDHVLMEELSAEAYNQPVVAKVQLLVDKERFGTMRVVEAMKGVVVGQEFDFFVNGFTCNKPGYRERFMLEVREGSVSDTYFVAGRLVEVDGRNKLIYAFTVGKPVIFKF